MTEKSPKTVQPIKLKTLAGGQSATFPLTIPLQRLDGTALEIVVTFHAFGKKAWSKIKDDYYGQLRADAAARAAAIADPAGESVATGDEPSEEDQFKLEPRVSKAIENDASLVMRIGKGWDLEDEFCAEKLAELEDSFGGAITSIVNAYDKAIYQGQLGN